MSGQKRIKNFSGLYFYFHGSSPKTTSAVYNISGIFATNDFCLYFQLVQNADFIITKIFCRFWPFFISGLIAAAWRTVIDIENGYGY